MALKDQQKKNSKKANTFDFIAVVTFVLNYTSYKYDIQKNGEDFSCTGIYNKDIAY